jgi:hypothetical protein
LLARREEKLTAAVATLQCQITGQTHTSLRDQARSTRHPTNAARRIDAGLLSSRGQRCG